MKTTVDFEEHAVDKEKRQKRHHYAESDIILHPVSGRISHHHLPGRIPGGTLHGNEHGFGLPQPADRSPEGIRLSVYNSHRISGHTHRMVHLRTLQILQVLAWKGDSCSQMEGDDHLHHADSRLHHGLLFHHESLPSRLPSQADDGY